MLFNKSIFVKTFYLLSILIVFSCSQTKDPEILAVFDGGDVRSDEYIEYYLSSTKYKSEEMPTRENLEHIVALKAFEKMAVQEAIERGIENDSLFQESVESNLRSSLFFKYMREDIINNVITEKLIKTYYDNFTPQYQVSYIVRPVKRISTAEFAQSQKDSIEAAYKMLKSGVKFEDVVIRYSQDVTTNQRGGNLGYVTGESLGDAALRAELKTLPQFTYSKPIRGYEAYYIMYKGDNRNVEVPPYEQARGKIWQSLYRSRKHDIQSFLDKKLMELEKKYQYEVNQKKVESLLKRAGKNNKTYITSELNFDIFTEEDMNSAIATYNGGEIKLYELFEEKNREPGNELEFNERLKIIKERHLLAKIAMELGYQNDPDIQEKMKDVRVSLLRSFLHKIEVVDKARTAKNIVETNGSEFQEAAVRRQLKEDLEKEMKKKYNFQFVSRNFKKSLKLAKEKKLIQNQEQEENKK